MGRPPCNQSTTDRAASDNSVTPPAPSAWSSSASLIACRLLATSPTKVSHSREIPWIPWISWYSPRNGNVQRAEAYTFPFPRESHGIHWDSPGNENVSSLYGSAMGINFPEWKIWECHYPWIFPCSSAILLLYFGSSELLHAGESLDGSYSSNCEKCQGYKLINITFYNSEIRLHCVYLTPWGRGQDGMGICIQIRIERE